MSRIEELEALVAALRDVLLMDNGSPADGESSDRERVEQEMKYNAALTTVLADSTAAASAFEERIRNAALNPSGYKLVRVSIDPVESWGARDREGWTLSYQFDKLSDGTYNLIVTRTDEGWVDAIRSEGADIERKRTPPQEA